MVWAPTAKPELGKTATPLAFNVLWPSEFPSAANVTVPVGTLPLAPVAVAVKVTCAAESTGLGLEERSSGVEPFQDSSKPPNLTDPNPVASSNPVPTRNPCLWNLRIGRDRDPLISLHPVVAQRCSGRASHGRGRSGEVNSVARLGHGHAMQSLRL